MDKMLTYEMGDFGVVVRNHDGYGERLGISEGL